MINRLTINHWVLIIPGILFLIISTVTLFRGIKRDKFIAISVFSICLTLFIIVDNRTKARNSKAEIYFGTHHLLKYNNSKDYKIEILPNNIYRIYNNRGNEHNNKWKVSESNDTTIMILLENGIFGIDEYEIKTKPNNN